jgi:hypothetical protein
MGMAGMAGGKSIRTSPLPPRANFEEIEAAVMETARGRWFLAEYARRHRAADTAAILEAIARLEAKLAAGGMRAAAPAEPPPPPAPRQPAPPAPEVADLKAMAEELLRGSRIFDWAEPARSGVQEELPEATDDSWAPEPESAAPTGPPAASAAPGKEESDSLPERPVEDEPTLEDEDIAAWEAELTERIGPLPLPPKQPDMRPEQRFPDVAAEPAGRPRETPPPAPFPRRMPPPVSESKPLPAGPRVDDPTLTMTRDEKLALFS